MIQPTVKPDSYARDVTPAEFRDLAIAAGWIDKNRPYNADIGQVSIDLLMSPPYSRKPFPIGPHTVRIVPVRITPIRK